MLSCVVMGKSIGHKIAILLAERRWRNTDLAVASGISLPTIGRWINDTHEPKARERAWFLAFVHPRNEKSPRRTEVGEGLEIWDRDGQS